MVSFNHRFWLGRDRQTIATNLQPNKKCQHISLKPTLQPIRWKVLPILKRRLPYSVCVCTVMVLQLYVPPSSTFLLVLLIIHSVSSTLLIAADIAHFIAQTVLKYMKQVDPDKELFDFFLIFDGAPNMQKGAKLIAQHFPRVTTAVGTEHIVSNFIRKIVVLAPFKQLCRIAKKVATVCFIVIIHRFNWSITVLSFPSFIS